MEIEKKNIPAEGEYFPSKRIRNKHIEEDISESGVERNQRGNQYGKWGSMYEHRPWKGDQEKGYVKC
eukprot:713151-Heterocapsa_arctica.AAC.1